jgi:hypothetical protein
VARYRPPGRARLPEAVNLGRFDTMRAAQSACEQHYLDCVK